MGEVEGGELWGCRGGSGCHQGLVQASGGVEHALKLGGFDPAGGCNAVGRVAAKSALT